MRQLAPTRIAEALPPERLLETNQQRLIRGGIACMHDIPTVQQYVAYENQHERRRWVLRMLANRASMLRELEIEAD
jgi:cell division FtsZ-interacting protein ZapD